MRNRQSPEKVLPSWMIKQGTNLTKEQRGEVKQEPVAEDDKTNLQNEYIKEYYDALLKKQQELGKAAKNQQEPVVDGISTVSSNRQVGIKSNGKRMGEMMTSIGRRLDVGRSWKSLEFCYFRLLNI